MLQSRVCQLRGDRPLLGHAVPHPKALANRRLSQQKTRQQRLAACQSTQTTSQHVILAPPASNTAPPESECLLVFVPGAMLGPKDFKNLAENTQASAPHVHMWAACMDINYMTLFGKGFDAAPDPDQLQALLDGVKDAAAEAGFKPRTSGWGRCTNMYLCLQSFAGTTFSEVAYKSAAGVILLASAFDGRYLMGKLPSLEDWGRPVMLLAGELDGQLRWPWQAGLAADAAVLAQKAGPRFAAAHQPFILIPGANHADTSNGVFNSSRGDIPSQADHNLAQAQMGKALGAFITAHESGDKGARTAATDELLLMVRQTAEVVGPYFMASGMGDICSAWVTGRQGGPESTASLDTPDTTHHHQHNTPQTPHSTHPSTPLQQNLLQGARRESGVKFSAALHPGVVQKAERFVAAAQLKLASSLPREVLGRLRIVVQIHTEIDTLLLNQPKVQEQDDGSVVVVVHALIAMPNIVRPGGTLPSCRSAAPEYWLKLKRPQAIADELGLPGTYADGVSAAALNRNALDAALATVPVTAAQRYKSHGWQLAFGEDSKAPDTNAEKFIKEGSMVFNSQGSVAADGQKQGLGTAMVCSPVLTSDSVSEIKQNAAGMDEKQAAMWLASANNPYMHRFLGNWYTKVMSVAQAMEWVMLDCLREDVTWP